MTLRKFAILAVAIPAIATFVACNSSYETSSWTASSAAIRTFSLAKDDSIVAHLDSVYFSIDLNQGLIFNADSLPYGTDITRLIPIIKTLETASVVELKVKRTNASDTTYNYLTNSTDSIDFSNPVNLRIVSYDGLNEFNYTIKVNVHKMITDSLEWSKANLSALPTAFSSPTAQSTARLGQKMFCLTSENDAYCLASYTISDLTVNGPQMDIDQWQTSSVAFPFTPRVETFSATDSELFILADDGTLYKSADGNSWQPTSFCWHSVYGEYDGHLLGSRSTDAGWIIESYPDGASQSLPDGMPIEATSQPVSYSFAMSSSPQLVIVGGRNANGDLCRGTWSFDGNDWMQISRRTVPEGLDAPTLTMYFSFKTLSSWNVITYPTLMIFGGKKSDGTLNSTVYVSKDFGINWDTASALMQQPSYMPGFYGAQAFVVESTFSTIIQPKIATPTETWTCPYIYLFGGYGTDGNLLNTLWRGTINRLTFAPLE